MDPNQKPTPKKFIMMFIRILILCALAYGIVYGAKFLLGML